MPFRLASAILAFCIFGQAVPQPATPQKQAAPSLSATQVWARSLAVTPAVPAAFDELRAYVAGKSKETNAFSLSAVSLADGSVLWNAEPGEPRSMLAANGLVFLADATSLTALSAADGLRRWALPLDSAPSASLCSVGSQLVVGTEDGSVASFSASDGSTRWQTKLPAAATSLAADRANIYVAAAGNRLAAIELTSGRILWQSVVASQPDSLLPSGDRLYVGTRGRWFYAVDSKTGHRKWRVRTGGEMAGRPVLVGDRVYFLSLDNLLRALDRNNGSIREHYTLQRRALSGPLQYENLLLVSGNTPTVEAVRFPALDGAGSFDAPANLFGPIAVARPASRPLVIALTGAGDLIGYTLEEKQTKRD